MLLAGSLQEIREGDEGQKDSLVSSNRGHTPELELSCVGRNMDKWRQVYSFNIHWRRSDACLLFGLLLEKKEVLLTHYENYMEVK